MITHIITIVLFLFLYVIAIVIGRSRSLFAAVMLSGIFSLISACLFVIMDAVDVAFTEAAVGAGVSTVLMMIVLNLTSDKESPPVQPKIFPLLVSLLTGGVLIYATKDMPAFGDPEAFIHQSATTQHYLFESYGESHIPNLVTTVLASYRGYDTLGETTVVFTAAIAVMLLLGHVKEKETLPKVTTDPIALIGAKMLIPYILLFALYVQFHGDFGPGGGFQAGVIFAAAFVLHGMVLSPRHTLQAAPALVIERLVALGVLLYAAVGVYCLFKGGNFLEYDVLLSHGEKPNPHGQHIGILLVEAGVGITVFAAMLTIFYKFSLRGRA
jgi:multicomponent Na+:H+ antiporter subunit B